MSLLVMISQEHTSFFNSWERLVMQEFANNYSYRIAYCMCICSLGSYQELSVPYKWDTWAPRIRLLSCNWGRRVIGVSGSLIWSETLMELIFNPCGEFRWSPEGPVRQIHSLHLLVGAPGIFSDLLKFVQMLKREGCGKQLEATAPIYP